LVGANETQPARHCGQHRPLRRHLRSQWQTNFIIGYHGQFSPIRVCGAASPTSMKSRWTPYRQSRNRSRADLRHEHRARHRQRQRPRMSVASEFRRLLLSVAPTANNTPEDRLRVEEAATIVSFVTNREIVQFSLRITADGQRVILSDLVGMRPPEVDAHIVHIYARLICAISTWRSLGKAEIFPGSSLIVPAGGRRKPSSIVSQQRSRHSPSRHRRRARTTNSIVLQSTVHRRRGTAFWWPTYNQ